MTNVWTRWRNFRHGVSERFDRLPKASKIGLIVVFIVFLYALPNKGFYEYLGLPLGEYIPLYTTRNDMATVLFQLATQSGLLTIASVLSSLYPAFTVLLAVLVLREHIHRGQAVGLGLAGAAVTLVALG